MPFSSSRAATGAISRGMPSSAHSSWEDYPIQEATEIGLSVRKYQDPPVFSVHRADGSRLFDDRDFERVRAYLMGFRDGMAVS